MSRKRYSFEDYPEHRKKLKEWNDKWIENVMSTTPMSEEDKAMMVIAIKGLYESAGLNPPDTNRIVFVPSPFVATFAGGFASSIIYRKENRGIDNSQDATSDTIWEAAEAATEKATREAAREATRDATSAAAGAATRSATWDATLAATSAATYAATDAATWAATWEATSAATDAATWDATWEATRDATEAATSTATYAAAEAATRDATSTATYAATYAATLAATRAATSDTTWEATRSATWEATREATREATEEATSTATYAATLAATLAATSAAAWETTIEATWDATEVATWEATTDINVNSSKLSINNRNNNYYSSINGFIDAGIRLNVGKFGFLCAKRANNMYQGGNFWSGSVSFLSFFKDIAKLDIDYSKYIHWENSTKHGSFRIMHKDFCIISDRPRILMVDDQGRPHREDGPYIQWSDGMGIFAWHGTRVPEWIIISPESITVDDIFKEENAEVRRVMMERFGFRKFGQSLIESGKAILVDESVVWGERVKYYHYNDGNVTIGFVHVINGTIEKDGSKHEFILTVKTNSKSAESAVMSTYPELMERLEKFPDKWEIIRNSIRS